MLPALPNETDTQRRLREAKQEDLREDGVFVTSGDGVALMDPVSGEVLARYSWDQVLKAEPAAPVAGAPPAPPVAGGTADPWAPAPGTPAGAR